MSFIVALGGTCTKNSPGIGVVDSKDYKLTMSIPGKDYMFDFVSLEEVDRS